MTRRETVIEALEHRETKPIPYTLDLTSQAADAMRKAGKGEGIESRFGGYITGTYYDGWPVEIPERPGYFLDDFGVTWNRNGADKDIGVVEKFIVGDPETSVYTFPKVDLKRFRADLEWIIANREDRFVTASFGFTMFERAWSLMGMENLLMYMIDCPEAVEAFLDRICDFFLELVDIALEYDVDCVHFGDDWGQQRGLIMGPAYWRRFIKPRMARLYARIKAKGKFVSQHSCGDCRDIFPDLVEIGLDMYQTFQPEIYPVAEMKKSYGDHISFWGGVSTQRCLPYRSPAEVQKEIVQIMKIAGKNGGLVIAPTHAVPQDVPVENILAMLEVFQNQDRFL